MQQRELVGLGEEGGGAGGLHLRCVFGAGEIEERYYRGMLGSQSAAEGGKVFEFLVVELAAVPEGRGWRLVSGGLDV